MRTDIPLKRLAELRGAESSDGKCERDPRYASGPDGRP